MSRQAESIRKKKQRRYGELVKERSPWIPRYKQLSDFILPFSGQFFASDRNKVKSFNNIYDSTGTRAHSILSAGLMAGMTSPARPWFRLATPDHDLMERASVKLWLDKISNIMRDIFSRSNTYRALHTQYDELGCFATAVNLVDDNFETVMWNHPLTAGQYCIAVNALGRVDTLFREFEMTVGQIVEKFVYDGNPSSDPDWSVVSTTIKNAWDRGNYDQWRPVIHAVEPRLMYERDLTKRDQKNMPFSSCYFEQGGEGDKLLRESGYSEFPGTAARWHTRGEDIYGNGPGFVALPDIKQLQQEQFRKGQAIDFLAKPPIELPPEAKGNEVEYLPGGTTIGTGGAPQRARNLVDIRLDLQHLLTDIQDVRQRINEAFFVPLFLMVSQMKGVQPRNQYEIAERHEEKLLMLGPVLERLHDELLAPYIDLTFAKIVNAGLLRDIPPPPEMEGMDLKVEFVSVLAQAQKSIGLGSLDRLLGTVGLIAQGSQDQSVWDKIDRDQVIDKYSDMLAVDPSVIVSDEKIVVIRKSRQDALAQQQMAAQAKPALQMAGAAKALGETDGETVKDNVRNLMGYS